MWEECAQRSINIVDSVIDILEPKAVVFTSISSWEAYRYAGKHKDDSKIIATSHPGYPYTWDKHLKRFNWKTGQEYLEAELKRIYQS